MKSHFFLVTLTFLLFYLVLPIGAQSELAPENLFSPAGTESDSSIILLWDKPMEYKSIVGYDIYKNEKYIGSTDKTNYLVKGLSPATSYSFYIKAKDSAGKLSNPSVELKKTTSLAGTNFNILKFGAIGDGKTINTKAIQKAIDACTPGGTVYIPAGTFLSGALFLKSNMTLYIAYEGILKGSEDIKDYYPLISTRFEGWEVKSFASLITAGKLDKTGPCLVTNITICGEGKIYGGGSVLGKAMTAAEGIRSRGRLICLMNCQNVNIHGLSLENAPCWNIHYTYCQNVVCHDLNIFNNTANGDGIDPDSSVDSYIFNCTFSTGDDCIAIKSGKNPEGNIIAKPCENIRITDCKFIKGHSLAIGSELSGGVKNVVIRDCELGHLDEGLRIKTNKFRGGYVENVTVKDCNLLKILITTSYTPNNDGAPAPELSVIKNLEFSNIDMTKAATKKPLISVDGFDDPKYYFKNMLFKDIKLPENATVSIKFCEKISFENVLTSTGQKPTFSIDHSTMITY